MFPTAPGNYKLQRGLGRQSKHLPADGGYRRSDRARRRNYAVRRSRRRQDDFARALIRFFAGDESIEVPSPTLYALRKAYVLPRFRLRHADLYRLSGPAELAEIGLEDAAEDAVLVIEWPDRAGALLPADRLDVAFTLAPQQGANTRNARITGFGRFAPVSEQIVAMRRFLDRARYGRATRRRIKGDASTRSYERLTRDGATYIFMNSPKRPDGPAVRNGKPYSAIAHLAEKRHAFHRDGPCPARPRVFRAGYLRCRPQIRTAGDRGSRRGAFVETDPLAPIEARYEAATDLLAELHGDTPPAVDAESSLVSTTNCLITIWRLS